MQKFNSIIFDICNISIGAGLIINDYYNSNMNVTFKEDKSPLTEADLASNSYIIESLSSIYSNIPILSEESFVDWNIRKNWKKYWLIDPLDGTKEFISKNGEFTVNIALIENNIPVIGVIYAPALSKIFFACKDEGSYKIDCNKKINSLDSSKKIEVTKKNISENINIISSRSHPSDDLIKWINDNVKNYNMIKRGSSLKFCDIAEGKADIYPRLGPTSEWDIAAGHIILLEAGGKLKTLDKKKILYNSKENVINPNFIASCNLT